MENLYCWVVWDINRNEAAVHYNFDKDYAPVGFVVVSEAGCVQEAERMLREERDYIREEGRRILEQQMVLIEQVVFELDEEDAKDLVVRG